MFYYSKIKSLTQSHINSCDVIIRYISTTLLALADILRFIEKMEQRRVDCSIFQGLGVGSGEISSSSSKFLARRYIPYKVLSVPRQTFFADGLAQYNLYTVIPRYTPSHQPRFRLSAVSLFDVFCPELASRRLRKLRPPSRACRISVHLHTQMHFSSIQFNSNRYRNSTVNLNKITNVFSLVIHTSMDSSSNAVILLERNPRGYREITVYITSTNDNSPLDRRSQGPPQLRWINCLK